MSIENPPKDVMTSFIVQNLMINIPKDVFSGKDPERIKEKLK